jgi:catechol 2,3-dioxygenase-like lactoylglutathione lyase family enzyme
MEPVLDHIQITVRDMAVAVPFYDRLLPLLGFSLEKRVRAAIPEHELEVVEYTHPRMALAITSPRPALREQTVHRRRPGSVHHIAFRGGSREEIDRLHREVEAIGAVIVAEPREYPEYTPTGYYAFFFKDLEGIKYEIVCHSGSA